MTKVWSYVVAHRIDTTALPRLSQFRQHKPGLRSITRVALDAHEVAGAKVRDPSGVEGHQWADLALPICATESPGVVSDDTVFALQVGRRKIPLSPAQGFDLAEHLIRGATRRMIVEEADRAAVLNVLHAGDSIDAKVANA